MTTRPMTDDQGAPALATSARLPNFLVIGSQRCGTTWLHHVLKQHPQIFLPERKELHFFDWRIDDHDLEWYLRNFRQAEPPRPFVGEISPGYVTMDRRSVRRVHSLLPDARILLILRNPIERAWSGAMYEMGTMVGRTARGISVGRALRHLERPRSKRRTDYPRAIRSWSDVYGDQFKVVFYEDMQRDASAYIREVVAHIGADPDWEPPYELISQRFNAADKFAMPPIVRWYLTEQWRGAAIELNRKLDGRAAHWLSDFDSGPKAEPSWRLRRYLNRLSALPYKAAYLGYSELREWRRGRRFAQVIEDAQRRGLLSGSH